MSKSSLIIICLSSDLRVADDGNDEEEEVATCHVSALDCTPAQARARRLEAARLRAKMCVRDSEREVMM